VLEGLTYDKAALQHTATPCNTLQHTATHCNTLRHTAPHCNTWLGRLTYDQTTLGFAAQADNLKIQLHRVATTRRIFILNKARSFPQKSAIVIGSFAENDLQFEGNS